MAPHGAQVQAREPGVVADRQVRLAGGTDEVREPLVGVVGVLRHEAVRARAVVSPGLRRAARRRPAEAAREAQRRPESCLDERLPRRAGRALEDRARERVARVRVEVLAHGPARSLAQQPVRERPPPLPRACP